MTSLKQQWSQLSTRFGALTRRERGTLAFALVAGVGFLLFNFLVDPHLTKIRQAARAEATARAELEKLQAQAVTLAGKASDPDEPNRQKLEALRSELAAVGERLAAIESRMVPPDRMRTFLEGVLAKSPGVELLGLRTLPATALGTALAGTEQKAAPTTPGGEPGRRELEKAQALPSPVAVLKQLVEDEGIFRHGIEIRLAGNYNELLGYMTELERLPQRVMWHSVSLSVERYPRSIMVLRVYTLSLDRKWLAI